MLCIVIMDGASANSRMMTYVLNETDNATNLER